MTPLVTFKGWEGKWWKNIKPGRAVLDAALTVLPGSGLVSTMGKRAVAGIGPKLIRKASAKIGRWWRSGPKNPAHPGIRAARGGSAITSGALQLGGGKKFSAGGPLARLNMGTAAKVGVGVAAAGAGAHALSVGKTVRPSAAVTRAHVGVMPRGLAHPAPHASSSTSPAPRTSSAPRSSSGCCPAGSRMLCFKRKRNPEAEAKRRARRKAAAERSKAKTARRHAKERAAVARRKSARSARALRRAIRGRKR